MMVHERDAGRGAVDHRFEVLVRPYLLGDVGLHHHETAHATVGIGHWLQIDVQPVFMAVAGTIEQRRAARQTLPQGRAQMRHVVGIHLMVPQEAAQGPADDFVGRITAQPGHGIVAPRDETEFVGDEQAMPRGLRHKQELPPHLGVGSWRQTNRVFRTRAAPRCR